MFYEGLEEVFEIMLTSLDEECVVTTLLVPVYIIEDDGMHLLLCLSIIYACHIYMSVSKHVICVYLQTQSHT